MTDRLPQGDLRAAFAAGGPWFVRLPDPLIVELIAERPEPLEALRHRPGLVQIDGDLDSAGVEVALLAAVRVASLRSRFAGSPSGPPRLVGSAGRLVEAVGAGAAVAYWLGSRRWSSARALACGLITERTATPDARARAIWSSWCEQSGALERLWTLATARPGLSREAAHRLERAQFALLFTDPRARDGAASFLARSATAAKRKR